MKIIMSPAKKMRWDRDSLDISGTPALLSKAEQVLSYLKGLSPEQLQILWGCNDKITAQNVERLRDMDLRRGLTPAVLSYDGLAYQHMAPSVFTDGEFRYVQEHLRILSGFYGVLRPMDGVQPYRLEMQAKANVGGCRDLYDFWGKDLYDSIRDPDGIILNLASKEYSRAIEKYLTEEDTYITCLFCQPVKGKLIQKATFAKMARGEMVRYLAERNAADPEEIKGFDRLGFHFRPDLSSPAEFLFERAED